MTADPEQRGGKIVPWRGRPRVADPKGRFVAVRVTAAEHAALTAAAAQAGLSVGAYLRARALGTPGPRAVRKPPIEAAALAEALRLLGKYGGNLNQLARAANAAGFIPAARDIADLVREAREVKAALMAALGREPAHGD